MTKHFFIKWNLKDILEDKKYFLDLYDFKSIYEAKKDMDLKLQKKFMSIF